MPCVESGADGPEVDPVVPEPASIFANAFANAPTGTRHDGVRRQLGNTR